MIRQPEREQLKRLTVKTLDQVFVMRAKEGLGCSLFEAQAMTDLVKEVYFPWLSQPGATILCQLVAGDIGARVLPDNGITHRFSSVPVTHECGLALVGDPYGSDILGGQRPLSKCSPNHFLGTGPNLQGIVFHPTGPG